MRSKNEARNGDLAIESRVRTPVKGLRTKLRTMLRAVGVTGKFRTDVHRDGRLFVIGDATCEAGLPNVFDGRVIQYVSR